MQARILPLFLFGTLSFAITACADDTSPPAGERDATGADSGSADTSTDATDGGLLDDILDGGILADSSEDVPQDAATADVDPTTGPMGGLYGPGVERIIVEFDYEVGAEPETSSGLGLSNPFDTFEANAMALFGQHARPISFASSLDEMGQIPDQGVESYDVDAILALSEQHRDASSTDTVRTFHIIWLDGVYADDSGERRNVLGVSLGDTEVVAMFKPIISGFGGALESQVEQATLVHEFGHAVGLTNRGVPMVGEDHHDEAHGAHCSNEDCIMYWTVDGPDVVSFLSTSSFGNGDVMFGEECLADVDAAAE